MELAGATIYPLGIPGIVQALKDIAHSQVPTGVLYFGPPAIGLTPFEVEDFLRWEVFLETPFEKEFERGFEEGTLNLASAASAFLKWVDGEASKATNDFIFDQHAITVLQHELGLDALKELRQLDHTRFESEQAALLMEPARRVLIAWHNDNVDWLRPTRDKWLHQPEHVADVHIADCD